MSAAGRIVIEVRPGEVRAAALAADGTPLQFAVERAHRASRVGAIHLGRVAAVRPEIGAAFIDIGGDADGFLNIKDGTTDCLGVPVAEGQAVLVQVDRDATPGKGPRLTLKPSLAGACLVLTPGEGGVGISKRITDDGTRARIESALSRLSLGDAGVVVRTKGVAASDHQLAEEGRALLARWDDMRGRAAADAPALLESAPALSARMLADWLGPETDTVLCDDAETLARLKARAVGDTDFRKTAAPAFRDAGIEDAFADALLPDVALAGGGRIAIHETPAMATVDVDAGGAAGGNAERLALETNLRAADALARQLVLRNIGGLIAVDFMKMRDAANEKRVLSALKRAMADDPAGPRATGFSAFGVVEIARRRTGPSLADSVLVTDLRPSAETEALEALAALVRAGGTEPVLSVSAAAGALLKGPLGEARRQAEARLGFDIRIAERLHDAQGDGGDA